MLVQFWRNCERFRTSGMLYTLTIKHHKNHPMLFNRRNSSRRLAFPRMTLSLSLLKATSSTNSQPARNWSDICLLAAKISEMAAITIHSFCRIYSRRVSFLFHFLEVGTWKTVSWFFLENVTTSKIYLSITIAKTVSSKLS